MGHEYAHGINHFSSQLVYNNEPGAINEGFSDIWGAMVEHFATPQKDIYLIGEEVTLNEIAIRSMKNPKLLGNPDTYQGGNWYTGPSDFGGVHTNSGVIGHWYYLLAEGSSSTDEINDNNDTFSFNGIGKNKASKILFHAQQNYFTNPFTDFSTASILTLQAAIDLYGSTSNEAYITKYAWHAVGIGSKPIQYSSHYINGPTQITPGTGGFYSLNPYAYATNYVWETPNSCYKNTNYCWEIVQGQGTNNVLIHGGGTGVQDIICKIYCGSTLIGNHYITVNVQNPYNGGGSNNTDDCVDLNYFSGVIYPPVDCENEYGGITNLSNKFQKIIIYNILGKELYNMENIEKIDLNFLNSGIFIFKYKIYNKWYTKKFIK